MNAEEYEAMIRFRKSEYNRNGWNALDLKAEDLMKAAGDQPDSLPACIEGMKKNMLEGDTCIKGDVNNGTADTTVRFYCDNLRPERRRIYG